MKTAQFIEHGYSQTMAEQRLYKLSTPMPTNSSFRDENALVETTEYVVVSALANAFDTGRPETFIFPADESGRITSWLELSGSQSGIYDHNLALMKAGYTPVYPTVIEGEHNESPSLLLS